MKHNKLVIRILLLVAKMVADAEWKAEIQNLCNFIQCEREL